MNKEFFCENLKYLRNINRLSKKEMAGRIKIGVKSLSKIEKGELPPRLMVDVLFELERSFGVEAYRFLLKNLGK